MFPSWLAAGKLGITGRHDAMWWEKEDWDWDSHTLKHSVSHSRLDIGAKSGPAMRKKELMAGGQATNELLVFYEG